MDEPKKSSAISKFISELRRRRVIRVVAIYAVVGWIIIEVASTVLPNLNLPEWTARLITILILLGFPITVIMAWVFDIGPGGVEKTPEVAAAATPATADAAPTPDSAAPMPAAETTAAPVPAPADDRKSIAVLPFVNMSGDSENEYFSDGISEEILNLLVKLPKLRVASRTSSFAFKGKDFDIPVVAKKLGVNTVLEGSVRRAGDRVRITAQLIDTASDSHLWSETYDREMKDVFEIQDDIAKSIVGALEVTLTPKERRALQYVATSDVAAFDFYLRGRRFFYSMTKRNFHHAISMYEQAIEQDPNYALAYAGIADAYSLLYQWAESSPEIAAKADEASRRAVELDSDSAEAHAARGMAHSLMKKFDDAEREFETAILLNPELFEAYYLYARDCFAQGKAEKAARLFAKAVEVNPADYQAPRLLAIVYRELGRDADSIEANLHTVKAAEKHLQLHPDDARALNLGACAWADLKERDKAISWAEQALEADRGEPAVLYNVACTYAQLEENDRAIELLTEAIDQGYGHRAWLENDGDLKGLREDSRFKALLQRLE
jgi:adenylate cyclase